MTFKSRLVAGLGTAFAVLLLVAAISYASLLRNASDRQWVTHTYEVLEKLADVETNLNDAESSQRGYLLTGEDSYLEPYEAAISRAQQSLQNVRHLTVDNPQQQHTLDGFEPLISERLTVLKAGIQIRKAEGPTAALEFIQEGTGKILMDKIRVTLAKMKAEEDRLLVERSRELDASVRTTGFVIIFGEALGLLFLGIAGFVIRQEMIRRQRAEEEVRKFNTDLEQRVAARTAELAERTKDLERSNMELEQFAYVASHDLQEPLRTISSFTQLLAKRYQDKLDDKAREFINFAVDGCKRLQTLINDLLAFSRVGTHGKPHVRVRCDAALDRVLKGLKTAIEDSGAVITRDALPMVLGDEGQLCQ